jgi:hypothetical protein
MVARQGDLLVLALALAASGCPQARTDIPEALDAGASSTADTSNAERSRGCRIEERELGAEERYEKWPSPKELGAAISHTYVGKVTWVGSDLAPPSEIMIDVRLDPTKLRLRYVAQPPTPGERIICRSSLIIPAAATLRLGDESISIEGIQVALDPVFSLSADLPPSFAGVYSRTPDEGHSVALSIPFHGRSVSGKFEFRGQTARTRPEIFSAEAVSAARRSR